MTLTAPYADHCNRCRDQRIRAGEFLTLAWPHAVDREGDWLRCRYRCPHCGHQWMCGYAVDAPYHV
jgi:transposase-like protein